MTISLTSGELEALKILDMGMARRATVTKTDREHGIHAVNGGVATRLIRLGLAAPVQHWDGCVEITEAGHDALRSRV